MLYRPGGQVVEGLQRFHNAGQMTGRQHEGQVARYRILQRGNGGGLRQSLPGGTEALQQIAQALHHDGAARQHVAQAGDVLTILNGLIEGLRKAGGHQLAKLVLPVRRAGLP